jgi:hypothetical protein
MAYEEQWSVLRLGSLVMPGVWTVEGDTERALDIKKRKGDDGAKITDNGVINAEITLVGRIALEVRATARPFDNNDARAMRRGEPIEISDLRDLISDIHPRLNRKAPNENRPDRAQEVYHPALDLMGVTAVYIRSIDFPTMDESGIVWLRIRAVEWIPESKERRKATQAPAHATAAAQRRANAEVTKGRVYNTVFIGPNGQVTEVERVDTGFRPPSDFVDELSVNDGPGFRTF